MFSPAWTMISFDPIVNHSLKFALFVDFLRAVNCAGITSTGTGQCQSVTWKKSKSILTVPWQYMPFPHSMDHTCRVSINVHRVPLVHDSGLPLFWWSLRTTTGEVCVMWSYWANQNKTQNSAQAGSLLLLHCFRLVLHWFRLFLLQHFLWCSTQIMS